MSADAPARESRSVSGTQEAFAGAVGGVSGVLFGHPLDTLRVRLQQPGSPHTLQAVLAQTLQREGFAALWKGLSSPLCTAGAQNALCFASYAASCSLLAGDEPITSSQVYFAGCAAGAATAFLVVPVDLIKTQLQTRVGRSEGPLALAASILSKHGVPGLYRGASITFLRDVPSSGVYFLVYHRALGALGGNVDGGAASSTLVAGGVAGVASWASIYPLDVCKSRIQAQPERWNRGWLDCMRRSVADEGVAVLTRGLGACLGRAFLVNAAIFSGHAAGLTLFPAL